MSLVGLVVVLCAIDCGDGKKLATGIDNVKVDSSKADVSAVKPDTLVGKKDTTKK